MFFCSHKYLAIGIFPTCLRRPSSAKVTPMTREPLNLALVMTRVRIWWSCSSISSMSPDGSTPYRSSVFATAGPLSSKAAKKPSMDVTLIVCSSLVGTAYEAWYSVLQMSSSACAKSSSPWSIRRPPVKARPKPAIRPMFSASWSQACCRSTPPDSALTRRTLGCPIRGRKVLGSTGIGTSRTTFSEIFSVPSLSMMASTSLRSQVPLSRQPACVSNCKMGTICASMTRRARSNCWRTIALIPGVFGAWITERTFVPHMPLSRASPSESCSFGSS
mmetsp:Transcript_137526/g.343119  ORF Transcript_137526/g.343119 Transcript_137526/m.343119 type:complete len:275 (-) Transcript_137526:1526-2350(-)